MEFYSVAAQVLPAMFLALAYESGTFSQRGVFLGRTDAGFSTTRILTMVILAVGEFCAFRSMYRGYASHWDSVLVRYALLWGGTIVIFPFAQMQLAMIWDALKTSPIGSIFSIALFAVVALFALMALANWPSAYVPDWFHYKK